MQVSGLKGQRAGFWVQGGRSGFRIEDRDQGSGLRFGGSWFKEQGAGVGLFSRRAGGQRTRF